MTDLKKQLQSHQENIQKLHSEREDLMQKIHDGEGTNAALQQLKQQNVRLFNPQGGPNQNLQVQMAITVKICIFDPIW